MEPSSRLQVLFLEDDPDTREMVTVMLSQSDIEVLSVETSREAMLLAGTKAFNAFLLDGMLPDGDSVRLCRVLKARFPERPVIFYTGVAESLEIERAMTAGAAAYLVKPYLGDLAKAVTDAVHFAANGSAAWPSD